MADGNNPTTTPPQPAMEYSALLRRARAGDLSAQNAILAKIRPWLRKSAAHFIDPRLCPRVDASDLVQDVLAREDITKCPCKTEGEILDLCGESRYAVASGGRTTASATRAS